MEDRVEQQAPAAESDPCQDVGTSVPDSTRRGWLHPSWLLLHGICLAALGLAWLFDEPLYSLTNAWYNGPEPLNGELHQLILSLAMHGQTWGIAISILLILMVDVKNRGRALIVGAAVLAGGLTCDLVKVLVGRERPLNSQGATVIHGPADGWRSSRNQSFPSGHTATAFALSYGLASFYPQTAVLVWPLAAGAGLNRVITCRHYLSDVVAGAWLGYGLAALILQIGSLRRLSINLSDRLKPGAQKQQSRHWEWSTVMSRVRKTIASPLLLVVVSLGIHWTGNAITPLWDRDEPRFATATREMLARGDWIVPTFNGELRPDKPILIYWLMGAAYRAFGDGPFAARFFSGLAGTLACVVTYVLGRSMFDKRVGLLAGWMLALSPMLIVESKLATVDALLLLFMTICFVCLWRLLSQGSDAKVALLFWMSLGLGILAKGPVILGVLAIATAGYCWLQRDFRCLAALRWKWGVPLLFAIVAPWVIAVHLATDGDFLRLALGHHVVKRSLAPLEGHRGFPGYYVVTLFAVMAPWAWLAPWSIRRHWSRLRSDNRVTFLLAWSIGTLILFESVKTKLVHYYLPAYPAIALLVASALIARFEGAALGLSCFDVRLARWLPRVVGALGLVAAIAAGIALPGELALPAIVVVTLVTGGVALGGLLLQQSHFERAFVVMAGAFVVSNLVAAHALAPRLGKWRLVNHVAGRLQELQTSVPVALWLYRDPSLVYNVGATLPVVDSMRSTPFFRDSLSLAMRHGRFVCPMTPAQKDLMAIDPSLSLTVVESIAGWDLNGGKKREVLLVEVRPSEDAAAFLQIQERLRERMPMLTELTVPLQRLNDAESENLSRRFPLNPGFLSDKANAKY